MSIAQVLTEVQEHAESIKTDELQHFPEAASHCDYHRQGDVYVIKLDSVPDGFEECQVERQLAPGNTRGSRHILSHGNVTMYKNPNANVLQGTVFKTDSGVTIEHPDHGDLKCPPGIYGITYQRLMADEIKRAQD